MQNMGGAGSLTAANFVYAVARPDGLTFVLPNNSIYVEQLVQRKEVQFDLRKFHWIGSASTRSFFTCVRTRLSTASPISSTRIVQVMLSGGEFGRPLLVTPGTPGERGKVLRNFMGK